MRQVKFRGKRIDNGEWVYGVPVESRDGLSLVSSIYHVDGSEYNVDEFIVIPETVGQFTGLLSEKRKKNLIPETYEGDIFRCADEDNGVQYCVVMWIEQRAAFYMVNVAHYGIIRDNNCEIETEFEWLFRDAALYDFSIDCGLTKVGNAHDNPELLK